MIKEGFGEEAIGVAPWVAGWGNVVITQVRNTLATTVWSKLFSGQFMRAHI